MKQQKRLTAFGECMIEFARSADPALWTRKFAGDTFNTAWYFNRLAAPEWATAYFTAVGDDAPSRDLVRFIEKAGISAEFVERIPNASPGLYLIELEGAERHFSYWRDSSAARRLAADRDRLASSIAASDVLYFSGITLAILPAADRAAFVAALAAARQSGRIVAFDPNIRPRLWPDGGTMREAIMEAAAAASIVFPTFSDDQAAFGDADPQACAGRYRALGVDCAVVKNGGFPCLAVSGTSAVEEPALAISNPVDTTGAGDSFNGAFLAHWVAGADMRAALQAAHRTAARTICGYGALVE